MPDTPEITEKQIKKRVEKYLKHRAKIKTRSYEELAEIIVKKMKET